MEISEAMLRLIVRQEIENSKNRITSVISGKEYLISVVEETVKIVLEILPEMLSQNNLTIEDLKNYKK